MRWRIVLLVAAMMAVFAVAGGAALAAAIEGTRGDDRTKGTNARDQLTGRGGDVLLGLRSADPLNGGAAGTPSTRVPGASQPGTSRGRRGRQRRGPCL